MVKLDEILDIRNQIIKLFYKNYLEWDCEIDVEKLFGLLSLEGKDKKKFLQALESLISEDALKLRSSTPQEGPKFKDSGMRDKLVITMEGLFFYELGKPQKEFTDLIVGLLHLFNEIDNGKYIKTENEIDIKELKDYYKTVLDIDFNFKKLYFFIDEVSEAFCIKNSFGYANNPQRIIFRDLNHPILRLDGKEFLEDEIKIRVLFQNVSDDFGRGLLREEYETIKFLWEKEDWKDIAIKMGSILEYLVTDYFEQKNISSFHLKKKREKINLNYATFEQKLEYIIENQLFGIEYNQDWKYAQSNIKEYRNYIHLQKLVKEKIIIDYEIITEMYERFERLISLF
jgi:hypothetical protein